jgi:hypothetical protein
VAEERRADDERRAEAARAAAARARADDERRERERTRAFGRWYLGPIALGSGAVLALAIGGGLLGSVGPDYGRLTSGPTRCQPCGVSSYGSLETRAWAGYTLVAIGAAAAAADVVWWIVRARRRPPPSQPAANAWIAPTGAGVAVGGAF